jgi:hypothetical protein
MPGLNEHSQAPALKERDVTRSFTEIDAEHNPVTSMAPKGTAAKATLIEWPLVTVATADSDAGVFDTSPVADADTQNFESLKAMLQGRIQKIREAIHIGDIAQETSNQYGEGGQNLFAQATKFALQKLRSKMERVTIANKDSVPQSGAIGSTPVAFVTRGLSNWIGRSNSGGDLPLPASWVVTPAASIYTTPDDTDLADVITEDDVRAVLRSVFTKTKRATTFYLFCNLDFQEAFNNFVKTGEVSSTTAPLRRFNAGQADGTITLNVQRYVGANGSTIILVPHLSLPSKVFGLLLDMKYVKLRMVRNPRFMPLPEDGSGPRGFTDAIFAVGCENPTAHGKFIQAAA